MKNSTKILIACGIVTALSTSILAAGQLMTIDVDPSIKKSLAALFFCLFFEIFVISANYIAVCVKFIPQMASFFGIPPSSL